jgi:hypothetical protein
MRMRYGSGLFLKAFFSMAMAGRLNAGAARD